MKQDIKTQFLTMDLSNSTFLITGGSSGIGLELTGRLLQQKNNVIICGRTPEKLEKAKRQLPAIHTIQCDLSVPDECSRLTDWISENHPDCNVLINNAAIVHRDPFLTGDQIPQKAQAEINTNLLAPIILSKQLLPVLMQNSNPAIINITTGLVYAPKALYPFYNATKAGLHAFTRVLREQLKETPVDVIEVLFPAVDTPWHNGNPPKIAITAGKAVDEMLKGIEKERKQIRVGGVKILYLLSRIAPGFSFKKINSLT